MTDTDKIDEIIEDFGQAGPYDAEALPLAINQLKGALADAGCSIEKGWQGIETAPKDGTDILLWVFVGGDGYVQRGFWNDIMGGWQVEDDNIIDGDDIDVACPHWRPLPEPPKETDHG